MVGRPFESVCPAGVVEPVAYSHGIVVPPGVRHLHVSGQIGVDADGRTAEGFERQAELACQNLLAVLAAAGMDASHLVKTTAMLTRPGDIPMWRAVRQRVLGTHRPAPASTLMVVSALANPQWLVEIEAVAASG